MIALEEPTRIDNGVANPKEQGQETINTAIALLIEIANSLLMINVTINVIKEILITTGTKIEAILSASLVSGVYLLEYLQLFWLIKLNKYFHLFY